MAERGGFEPLRHTDCTRLIDSMRRQERQKRPKSQSDVHGGYTETSLLAAGSQHRVVARGRAVLRVSEPS
jgi:hypothetical protein